MTSRASCEEGKFVGKVVIQSNVICCAECDSRNCFFSTERLWRTFDSLVRLEDGGLKLFSGESTVIWILCFLIFSLSSLPARFLSERV